jgi:hypothetical protein
MVHACMPGAYRHLRGLLWRRIRLRGRLLGSRACLHPSGSFNKDPPLIHLPQTEIALANACGHSMRATMHAPLFFTKKLQSRLTCRYSTSRLMVSPSVGRVGRLCTSFVRTLTCTSIGACIRAATQYNLASLLGRRFIACKPLISCRSRLPPIQF